MRSYAGTFLLIAHHCENPIAAHITTKNAIKPIVHARRFRDDIPA